MAKYCRYEALQKYENGVPVEPAEYKKGKLIDCDHTELGECEFNPNNPFLGSGSECGTNTLKMVTKGNVAYYPVVFFHVNTGSGFGYDASGLQSLRYRTITLTGNVTIDVDNEYGWSFSNNLDESNRNTSNDYYRELFQNCNLENVLAIVQIPKFARTWAGMTTYTRHQIWAPDLCNMPNLAYVNPEVWACWFSEYIYWHDTGARGYITSFFNLNGNKSLKVLDLSKCYFPTGRFPATLVGDNDTGVEHLICPPSLVEWFGYIDRDLPKLDHITCVKQLQTYMIENKEDIRLDEKFLDPDDTTHWTIIS